MKPDGPALRERFQRLRESNPRSWLIGVIVALLGWQVSLEPPVEGLDESWWAGLYMAAHAKLQFGTEIVFTYGPLGILRTPGLFYPGALSLLPYLYAGALFTGFCVALVALLRRRVGWPLAAMISLAFVLLLDLSEPAVAISMLSAVLIIERRPGDRWLLAFALAGGLLAGIEMLVKLSAGPVVALVLLLGLIGARARPVQVGAYLLASLVSFFGFWLLTGQSLANLPDFVRNSIQIVSGYSEAMSLYSQSPVINLVFVGVTSLATALWAVSRRYGDRRADLASALIALAVTFAFYKQAIIRSDGMHLAAFFTLLALLWIAFPARRRLLPIGLAGLAVFAVTASLYGTSVAPGPGFNPVDNLRGFVSDTRTAFSVSRQEERIAEARAELKEAYDVNSDQLASLDGHGVSVEPWETMVVWPFELEWSPVPVFQNYSAYTAELDRLNAETVAAPDGPERILRHPGLNPRFPRRSIDTRNQAWDPPAQAVATLCHFAPAGTSLGWQVLVRTENRCGPMEPAGSVESSFGERVEVPRPGRGEVILVRIHGAEVSGLEKLRSLLFRPRERRVDVGNITYRLVPATASGPMMLRGGPGVAETGGRFAQVPEVRSLRLTGSSGELQFEFFRMRVDSPGLQGWSGARRHRRADRDLAAALEADSPGAIGAIGGIRYPVALPPTAPHPGASSPGPNRPR